MRTTILSALLAHRPRLCRLRRKSIRSRASGAKARSSEKGPIDCSDSKRVIDFNGDQRTDSNGGVPAYRNQSVVASGPSSYRVIDEFSTGQISAGQTLHAAKGRSDRIEMNRSGRHAEAAALQMIAGSRLEACQLRTVPRDDLALAAMDRRSLARIAVRAPQQDRGPPALERAAAAAARARALYLNLAETGIGCASPRSATSSGTPSTSPQARHSATASSPRPCDNSGNVERRDHAVLEHDREPSPVFVRWSAAARRRQRPRPAC